MARPAPAAPAAPAATAHRACCAIALRTLGLRPAAVVDILRAAALPHDRADFLAFSADLPPRATRLAQPPPSPDDAPPPDRAAGHRADAARRWAPDEAGRAWDAAARTLEACARIGVTALAFGDPGFPARLAALQPRRRTGGGSLGGACVLLYCRGAVEALDAGRAGAAAVIGARTPTGFGLAQARAFGRGLAEAGVVVVSGLARGCDTAAHEGCLDVPGVSVAVLAHGPDLVYPPENADLAARLIAAGGCLVSEYPPGAPPLRRRFAERDRIQAGLSDLVIVIETPGADGTMITVAHARRQRRPVGCLAPPRHPADDDAADDGPAAGNRRLLSDARSPAARFTDPADALRALAAGRRGAAAAAADDDDDDPRTQHPLPLR